MYLLCLSKARTYTILSWTSSEQIHRLYKKLPMIEIIYFHSGKYEFMEYKIVWDDYDLFVQMDTSHLHSWARLQDLRWPCANCSEERKCSFFKTLSCQVG